MKRDTKVKELNAIAKTKFDKSKSANVLEEKLFNAQLTSSGRNNLAGLETKKAKETKK